MIKKFFTLLFFSTGLTYYPMYSQNFDQLPGTSIQGNSISDFAGVFSDGICQVDLYTGIGNVNIPIYNYSINGLDLGVSLNYNMKGIMLDQIASSVGLGWELYSGGYITRKVNNIEDEVIIPGVAAGIIANNSNNLPVETEYDVFTASFAGRTFDFTMKGVTYPDLPGVQITNGQSNNTSISYLYNNYNQISFTITDEKGNIFLFDVGDVMIKTNSSVNYYATQKWNLAKVTTYDGKVINYSYHYYNNVVYPFYNADEVDVEIPNGNYSPQHFALSNAISNVQEYEGTLSHISEIDYPDGKKVNFNMNSLSRCDILNGNDYILGNITITGSNNSNVSNSIKFHFNQAYFNSPYNSTDPVFSQTELPLAYNSTDPATYYTNYLMTNLSMQQDQAGNWLNTALRLKLKSITKSDGSNSNIEPYYSFGYYSTVLAPRLSGGQDWFGYYNGNTASNSSFPETVPLMTLYPSASNTSSTITIGVDKSTNSSNMQADLLTSITNGYGGVTGITYEAPPNLSNPSPFNTPSHPSSTGFAVASSATDGLCVRSLSYNDGFNSDNNFVYNFDYSNGVFFFPFGYCNLVTKYDSTHNTVNSSSYFNHFVSPYDFLRGSNHGYSHATVTKNGYNWNNSTQISQKIYTFTNLNYLDNNNTSQSYLDYDRSDYSKQNFPRKAMTKSQMGLVTDVKEYFDNPTVPIKEIQNTYGSLNSMCSLASLLSNNGNYNTAYFGWSYLKTFTYPQPTHTNTLSASFSYPYNPLDNNRNVLTSSTITENSLGQSFSKTTNYNYDGFGNIASESWTDSKNKTYLKSYYYPYTYINYCSLCQYSGQTCQSEWQYELNNFTYSNISNPCGPSYLTGEELQDITDPNNPLEISFQQRHLVSNYGVISTDYLVSSALQAPLTLNTFHQNLPSTFPNNYGNMFYSYTSYVPNKISLIYDDHNNVIQSFNTYNHKYSSAIWDTYSQKKMTSASNAQYSQIAYCGFDGNYSSGSSLDYSKGNWLFDPAPAYINTSSSLTGYQSYYVWSDYGHVPTSITSNFSIPNGAKYILSFWAQVCWGSSLLVYMGSGSNNIITMTQQSGPVPGIGTPSCSGWYLYTATITGNGNPVVVGCNWANYPLIVDELRLYPVDATMRTAAYEPLFGVQSICDERNNILYYQYDAMGRLNVVRDIDGNILTLSKHTVDNIDN